MTGIVIVGGGLAALRSAEALRSTGWTGDIRVYGDEPHPPYTRPPLSKELLQGRGGIESLTFPVRAGLGDVQWRLGEKVVGCDLGHRTVTLEDGTTSSFEGLVAATGVRARRLPFEGAEDRWVLRTFEDAHALRDRLLPGARVVVIGGGFIGCEAAATARAMGCDVAVVTMEQAPLVTPLGPLIGEAIQRHHERAGIKFHLSTTVGAFEGPRAAQTVRLDNGHRVEADVVIEAVGSAPNVEWLQGTPVDLTDGALCDSALRLRGATAAVAVGDVARFPHPWFGVTRRIEHWSVPGESARHAASTLLRDLDGASDSGPVQPFAPLPSFWSHQGDLRIQCFGMPDLADETEVLEGELDSAAAVGHRAGGRLIAVTLVNLPGRAGYYRRHLLDQVGRPLTPVG